MHIFGLVIMSEKEFGEITNGLKSLKGDLQILADNRETMSIKLKQSDAALSELTTQVNDKNRALQEHAETIAMLQGTNKVANDDLAEAKQNSKAWSTIADNHVKHINQILLASQEFETSMQEFMAIKKATPPERTAAKAKLREGLDKFKKVIYEGEAPPEDLDLNDIVPDPVATINRLQTSLDDEIPF